MAVTLPYLTIFYPSSPLANSKNACASLKLLTRPTEIRTAPLDFPFMGGWIMFSPQVLNFKNQCRQVWTRKTHLWRWNAIMFYVGREMLVVGMRALQ